MKVIGGSEGGEVRGRGWQGEAEREGGNREGGEVRRGGCMDGG